MKTVFVVLNVVGNLAAVIVLVSIFHKSLGKWKWYEVFAFGWALAALVYEVVFP